MCAVRIFFFSSSNAKLTELKKLKVPLFIFRTAALIPDNKFRVIMGMK